MQAEDILKWIPVIVAAFVASKFFYDLACGDKSSRREEYKIAKDFLEYRAANEHIHHYVEEKGYQAIIGSSEINIEDAEFLLNSKNTSKTIKSYLLARKYLSINHDASPKCFCYVGYCDNLWSRVWRKGFYLTLYILCFCGLMSPMILVGNSLMQRSNLPGALLFTIPVFGYYGYLAIREFARLVHADALVTKHELMQLIPGGITENA